MMGAVSSRPLISGNWRLRERALPGLLFQETEYVAGYSMPPHAHATAAFGLVTRGTYVERVGRREFARAPGTLVFHAAGEEHAVDFAGGPVRIARVDFSAAWLAGHGAAARAFERHAETGGASAGLAAAMWARLAREPETEPLELEERVCEVLEERAREPRPEIRAGEPRWMRELRDRLHARPEAPASLSAMAQEWDVHPSHVARAFRARHGVSIGAYVRRLRIERAAREIRAGEKPLAQIAAEAGFADQSHMTRIFRAAMRATPGEYARFFS